MSFPRLGRLLPRWTSLGAVVLSAVLFILAFPDFDLWFLAWFGLVPLLWSIDRESESVPRSFLTGWIWGVIFFTGTCWWLTFAPITYAGFPPPLAYFLLICVTSIVAVFPGLFGVMMSVLMTRFGGRALYAAPFAWVFTEFLRYWITGNNWNAIGYSQAFSGIALPFAGVGGIYLTSFIIFLGSFFLLNPIVRVLSALWLFAPGGLKPEPDGKGSGRPWASLVWGVALLLAALAGSTVLPPEPAPDRPMSSNVVAIQPNVPMSGLSFEKWQELRAKHVELAESVLKQRDHRPATIDPQSTTVVFPESPMNFMYEDDEEFRTFVHAFARKHDVQVLFNSAEPDAANDRYFNSAVLVGPNGKELAQYDKIYLVPFGESVPAPLQSIVPALVGSFSYGKEYDLLPLGEAKAGVMICFESHFGELSREYVRNGADAIIEMTNDGYLGPTPVLRQHLANAVFRAVETNRPVLRVTNVGITAYIDERGKVHGPSEPYTDTTRLWRVGKSDGYKTLYVRYGDWFAWLCTLVTLVLFALTLVHRPKAREQS